MARSIPKSFSGVLEKLELERPQLVTTSQLASLCERSGIRTPAKVVASRLRERGWLLTTPQRGVWEFAPAELAGPYSSADPLLVFANVGVDGTLSRFSTLRSWAC